MAIPFKDFGGAGSTIHFTHANAYHPGSYRQLLTYLTGQHRVLAMHLRPLWKNSKPADARNWHTHANDLIRFLEQENLENIVGIGHSLGAVSTLFAAVKRPALFDRIIVIDPVFLPPKMYRFTNLLPTSIRQKIIPPAKIARKRRYSWSSKAEAYSYLRPKRVFGRISDEVFRDIIEYGIEESADGQAQLTFSREWEAHIYSSGSNPWRAIKKVRVPMLVIRGDQSNVLLPKSCSVLQKLQPEVRLVNLSGTHLIPFEEPKLVARQILEFLK